MTEPVNNARLLTVAKNAALAAGEQIRLMFDEPRMVTSKGPRDVVTDADLAAQAIGNARAIEHDKKEIRDLKQELQGKYEIIGESRALRKVISDAIKVANSKASTLILGESGTGKELTAHIIHRNSDRGHHPFIPLNCKSFGKGIAENQMYDHVLSLFKSVNGGTIFFTYLTTRFTISDLGKDSISPSWVVIIFQAAAPYFPVI